MNSKITGVICVITAGLIWAIEPVLAKLSYSKNADIFQTSLIRAFFCSAIALLYALITTAGKIKINRKQLSAIVYIAIAGTIVADILYYFALNKTPVINAVLIGHLQPVFIAIIGFVIHKEDKLSDFDILGIFFMITAGVMVISRTTDNILAMKFGTVGDALVLSATVLWATAGIAAKKYLGGLNSGVITFYRFMTASIAFLVYAAVNRLIFIDNIYQVILGIIIGIGYILYYEGLKRLKAAQVGALELSAPVFAGMFGFIFFREIPTSLQMAGLICLFIGIHFISKKET